MDGQGQTALPITSAGRFSPLDPVGIFFRPSNYSHFLQLKKRYGIPALVLNHHAGSAKSHMLADQTKRRGRGWTPLAEDLKARPDKTINDFGIHCSCFALSMARDIVALRAIGKHHPAPLAELAGRRCALDLFACRARHSL